MVAMSEPVYSIDEIRDRLPQLLEAVADGERVMVRRDDGTEFVLVSKDDLESLEATLETLSDPDMMAGLRRSLEQEARGEFIDVDDLR